MSRPEKKNRGGRALGVMLGRKDIVGMREKKGKDSKRIALVKNNQGCYGFITTLMTVLIL
ncbi:hypothetical protein XYCOK13_43670 [Xylanibacillus composti]|uniref:Uncharacterized protein n=1 Tax=Xylanibacillus composti TaxID=1572762 RepID=A0A8J4H972_9BACL|nr:hypothetical protein XYCOK13_43670 [Xylanibacillus composti]